MERANGYLETSFLPGRAFASASDFNTQLMDWLASIVNCRIHASTRLIPAEVLAADRTAAARGSGDWYDDDDAARPRLLRQRGRQRLLDASGGDRADDNRASRLGPDHRPVGDRFVTDHERL